MSKFPFPFLALVCALSLAACGEDTPASADAESSDADLVATPRPEPEQRRAHDPELEMALKIREANADDPRVIFTKAALAAVENRRQMLIECSLKPKPARKVCEDAAETVYQAARADAAAAKGRAMGKTSTDAVEASDATASSAE